jgi:hypothetical protein
MGFIVFGTLVDLVDFGVLYTDSGVLETFVRSLPKTLVTFSGLLCVPKWNVPNESKYLKSEIILFIIIIISIIIMNVNNLPQPQPIDGLYIDDYFMNIYKRPRSDSNERSSKKSKSKFGIKRKSITKRKTSSKRKPTTKRKTSSKRKPTTKRKTSSKRKPTTKRKTSSKRKPTTKRKTSSKRKPTTKRKTTPKRKSIIKRTSNRTWKVSFKFKFIRTWEDTIPPRVSPVPLPNPTEQQLNIFMRTRYLEFIKSMFVYDEYGKMPTNIRLNDHNVVSFEVEKGNIFPTADSVIRFIRSVSFADGVWEGQPGSAGVYPDPTGRDELGVIGIEFPSVNNFGKKKKRWIQSVTKTFEKKGTKGAFTKWCRSKGYPGVTMACIKRGKSSKSLRTRRRAIFAENIRK